MNYLYNIRNSYHFSSTLWYPSIWWLIFLRNNYWVNAYSFPFIAWSDLNDHWSSFSTQANLLDVYFIYYRNIIFTQKMYWCQWNICLIWFKEKVHVKSSQSSQRDFSKTFLLVRNGYLVSITVKGWYQSWRLVENINIDE